MSTAITHRTERFAHFGLGHQVEYDAARIGLVRNAFGRNLDRYRKTDAACGGSRFVFAGGKRAGQRRDSETSQQFGRFIV